jgi:hypothetical protein
VIHARTTEHQTEISCVNLLDALTLHIHDAKRLINMVASQV